MQKYRYNYTFFDGFFNNYSLRIVRMRLFLLRIIA